MEHQQAQHQAQVIVLRVSKPGAAREPFLGADRRAALAGLEQSLQRGSNASGEQCGSPMRIRAPTQPPGQWGVGNGQGDQTQQEKGHSFRAETGSLSLGKRNATGTSEAIRMFSG